MKTMINKSHIEGLLYEHDLKLKVTGPNSKNPGTQYISGTISIATDNDCVNIVEVHFTYVAPITAKGKTNTTFNILQDIINGKIGTIMGNGKENAGKISVDSAINLNEFPNKNKPDEFISVRRNEGGFVNLVSALNEDEKVRNTFECDMIITNVSRIEADEEKNLPEKVTVRGAIFDFKKALLPVEFTVLNTNGMDYFEGLGATPNEPIFTNVRGRQISQTIVKKIVEESAFGDDMVKEVKNTRKDFVITGSRKEVYNWNDESTITADELKNAMAERETYLATLKKNREEYEASKAKSAAATAVSPTNDFTAPTVGGFKF